MMIKIAWIKRSNFCTIAGDNKQIEGQLTFDFCLDTRNYVCQANSLVGDRQALKLNSAKLIRAAIMQITKEDEKLKPYIVTILELSKLLDVPKNNIYRDIDDITDDILNNPVHVQEDTYNGSDKDEEVPLAPSPEEIACCILHLLILCLAMLVELYYFHDRKKRQKEERKVRLELGR